MKKETIEVTEGGKVIQTKEIDGEAYFRQQERELANIEKQIARLQEIRKGVLERLKKKPELETILEKKREKQENERKKKVKIEKELVEENTEELIEDENISETEESDVLISD